MANQPRKTRELLSARPAQASGGLRQWKGQHCEKVGRKSRRLIRQPGISLKVLFGQPCHYHRDRSRGHRTLLDCFAGRHGSECDICGKEALFAMQEHRKGKSV